ncbi:MAG: winged helix-turn-helix transcriptional regulator [Burkholderiaceae bacterium]|nr:winged helix-turn-helix domain-containing protein [Aquabacterium sp.]NUP87655.1 winged helix-turn-helix transcriptional regulator [Burkholderiaceae bacterium]
MNIEQTAQCMAALGSVARLQVFAVLVRAGDEGLTITELRQALALPASTLAHHLRAMVDAGLVVQERIGREVCCRPDFRLINAAWAHFRAECCQGVSATPAGAVAYATAGGCTTAAAGTAADVDATPAATHTP